MFEDGGELQDVATDGIGDFDSGGGIVEFTGVAGGLEMVEEDGGEHGESIAAVGSGVEGEKRDGDTEFTEERTQSSQRRMRKLRGAEGRGTQEHSQE